VAGTYTARLTVTDNTGATGTTTQSISVASAPPAIAAPTGLTGSGSRGRASLSWIDNSTNETGFYIERAPSGTTNYSRVGQVAANVRTFSQNVARGTYLYRVQAFNSTATSAYSNVVSVRVR
jgi:hypothetical protein